jgi:hypothetical protein
MRRWVAIPTPDHAAGRRFAGFDLVATNAGGVAMRFATT